MITKSENKSIGSSNMNEERADICSAVGHRFSPAIEHALEDPVKYVDNLPDKALCIRCGQKIALEDIIAKL